MKPTSLYWIIGIGFWIGAVVGATLTFMERRAIVHGRRATGSWLARSASDFMRMNNTVWILLALTSASMLRRTLMGEWPNVGLPTHLWMFVGVWLPLKLAFAYMARAAQWAAEWTWTPTGEGRRTPRAV
jgi:hypothetical protein